MTTPTTASSRREAARIEAEAADAALQRLKVSLSASPANDGETAADPPVAADPAPAPAAPVPPPVVPPAPAPLPSAELDRARREAEDARRAAAEASDTVRRLQEDVRQLKAQQAAAQPAPAPAPVAPSLSPKEIEDFGPEFIDVVKRIVGDAVQAPLHDIGARLARIENVAAQTVRTVDRQGAVVRQTAEEKMMSTLDTQVPGWRQADQDDRMLDWLEKPRKYAREPRKVDFAKAVNERDTDVLIEFYRDFMAEVGITPAAHAPNPQTSEPVPASAPTNPLAALVAPGAAPPANPSTTPLNGKVYTEAEVRDFYDPRNRAKYTPADRTRIEADIDRAFAEGRIRG